LSNDKYFFEGGVGENTGFNQGLKDYVEQAKTRDLPEDFLQSIQKFGKISRREVLKKPN